MEGSKGYVWAISAGLNAALSAIAAKLFSYTVIFIHFIRFTLEPNTIAHRCDVLP